MNQDRDCSPPQAQDTRQTLSPPVCARAADKREAVDVKADDFDGVFFYVCVAPEQRDVLRVSLFAPCFSQIKEAVGEQYFADLYSSACASIEAPQAGYSLTVAVNLDALPPDNAAKGAPPSAAQLPPACLPSTRGLYLHALLRIRVIRRLCAQTSSS